MGRRPLSRFMFGVAYLIWMASTLLLSQNPSALLRIVALSQLMQWFRLSNVNCNAIFGVSSFHRLSMFTQSDFRDLLFSPTNTAGQSLQGISYTTNICFCSRVLFFICITCSSLYRVFLGLKTGFTPRGAQTIKIFLQSPLM